MVFEVIRTTIEKAAVETDSPAEAVALAKHKLDHRYYGRDVSYAVHEVHEKVDNKVPGEQAVTVVATERAR